MNGNCFDIGTIQAFLDGETAPDISLKITNHAAACTTCSEIMAEAEEQNSFVFSALDREYNSLVPTQRLWGRINDSIALEKSQAGYWEKIRRAMSVLIANPSMTVAASVLIVFGLFAVIWNFNSGPDGDSVDLAASQTVQQPSNPIIKVTGSDDVLQPSSDDSSAVKATNFSPEKLKNLVTNANHRPENTQVKPQNLRYIPSTTAATEYLPGEESYVKTIASLKQNIDNEKDIVLRPSTRIAYERDMAVVDDAISKMKAVVRKDPKNQSAKQLLYSSYQNKIDLLNSVADREELMASLR